MKDIHEMGQKTITDDELNALLKKEMLRQEKLFNEEEIVNALPVLQVYTRRNFGAELEVIPVFFADLPYEDRHEMFIGLGGKLYDTLKKDNLHPIAIFMSVEAWLKKMKPEEQKAYEEGKTKEKAVHDYEDKEEAYVVFGMTIDRRHVLAMTNIIRKGKYISIVEKNTSYSLAGETNGVTGQSPLLAGVYRGYAAAMFQDRRQKKTV